MTKGSITSQVPVIWTPTFLLVFTFVLVVGLSLGSLLTQGWLNKYYAGEIVLLSYCVLIGAGWCVILVRIRASWVRIGALSGLLWTVLLALDFILSWLHVNLSSSAVVHLTTMTNCALFACFTCLSLAQIPLRRWEIGLFGGILLFAVCLIAVYYWQLPTVQHTLSNIESMVAVVALYFSLGIWWLRPICWRIQPGLTLLLGMVPLLFLFLPLSRAVHAEANFFFAQITLLCALLAVLRFLQGELKSWGGTSQRIGKQ